MTLRVEKCGLQGLAPRRKNAGYTQGQIAEALGVERQTYGNWECGYIWPNAAYLPKIADLLCCSIDDLYKPFDPSIPEEATENHGA